MTRQAVRAPRDMTPSEFQAWREGLEARTRVLDWVVGIGAFIGTIAVFALVGAGWVDLFTR